jgi:methylase of polypeptide subunit release factors
MGFQIPGPTNGKVQYLVERYQAEVLDRAPRNFDEIPEYRAIICVIDTRDYEVASYAFSRQELSADWLEPHPAVVAILPELHARGARRVLDLGCGVGPRAVVCRARL